MNLSNTLITLTLSLGALSTMAGPRNKGDSIRGTITGFTCGEIDPYVVGDACLVSIDSTRGPIMIVASDYDLLNQFALELKLDVATANVESAVIGKKVFLSRVALERIKDSATLETVQLSFLPTFQTAFMLLDLSALDLR